MPTHSLTNFEIQMYHQNQLIFNGVYARNNLPKIKNGTYVINLVDFKLIGTHLIALYVNGNIIVYFDSFGLERIPKEIKKFIGNKNIITSIYRTEVYDSIMCQYICIGFINFMLKGKGLLDYTNLFSPNDYEKDDKIILKYFQYLHRLTDYIILYYIITLKK